MNHLASGLQLDVEAGKVREFARAVHADLADLVGSDGSLTIPPTFLTTTNFAEEAEAVADELGFDLGRMLHAEQEYEFPGAPPIAGSRLHATSRIEERFTKQGRRAGLMTFAVRVTEFRDDDGALVATARMTAVETQPAQSAGASS
jgi:hypothetical protein